MWRIPSASKGEVTMTTTVHELKCWPAFFDAVARGEKTFEIRKDDRGFQRGDRLRLLKYDPRNGGSYVPASLSEQERRAKGKSVSLLYPEERAVRVDCEVTYVLAGWGIEPGYVCMGIKLVGTGDGDAQQIDRG